MLFRSVADVLRYVAFDAENLIASYAEQLAKRGFDAAQQASMLDELKAGVYGYTYFED